MLQAQMDQQADERKAQIEAVQAQADMATQDKKNENEALLKQQDFALKRELALLQAQIDMEKFQREEARKEREFEQKLQLEREAHAQALQAGAFKVAQSQETHAHQMSHAESQPSS